LKQLLRFHCLAEVLAKSTERHGKPGKGHLVFRGPTLSDRSGWKTGVLARADHGVLKRRETLQRIADARKNQQDHLVLVTDEKPKGVKDHLEEVSLRAFHIPSVVAHLVSPVVLKRCWYVYWAGDLSRKLPELDLATTCVRIKPPRSRRLQHTCKP
jgi:hypothetical protein